MPIPRVAYFPDSFHEINGVAHTSRNFVAYAQRHNLPLLCVRAGMRAKQAEQQGSVRTLELARSRAAVGIERDLAFDPLFWRHADAIESALHQFQPDLLHLTGPSELGIFAAYFAGKLGLPLAASWHTNVHEYASRRLAWMTNRLGGGVGDAMGRAIEGSALQTALHFYTRAQILYAPNTELCDLLTRATGKSCLRMPRGVDPQLFNPALRTRPLEPQEFHLGFVGRLSVEKNVALLPRIQRELDAAGVPARFVIIGHGAEETALRRSLPTAHFTGVLRGEALAAEYANMDLLVFPSHTDTFGNVVLEALASGVPAVVTTSGGPKFIVRSSTGTGSVNDAENGSRHDPGTGVIAEDGAFASEIARLLHDPPRLRAMRLAARNSAVECSWDAVFSGVYQGYEALCEIAPAAEDQPQPRE